MGETNNTTSRRKIAIDAIAQKAIAGIKVAEELDFVVMDIFTGYVLELDESGKVKVNEVDHPQEAIQRQRGLIINVAKREDEVYASLMAVLPLSPEVIIDKNEDLFDYDYDNVFHTGYTSIEIALTGTRKQLDDAITDLALESQRVLQLYGEHLIE